MPSYERLARVSEMARSAVRAQECSLLRHCSTTSPRKVRRFLRLSSAGGRDDPRLRRLSTSATRRLTTRHISAGLPPIYSPSPRVFSSQPDAPADFRMNRRREILRGSCATRTGDTKRCPLRNSFLMPSPSSARRKQLGALAEGLLCGRCSMNTRSNFIGRLHWPVKTADVACYWCGQQQRYRYRS